MEMTEQGKTVKVSVETHAKLDSMGQRGESFDQIIQRLIEAYEKTKSEEA